MTHPSALASSHRSLSSVGIEEIIDKGPLRALLGQDPLTGAYLLGDLDEAFFRDCRWFGSLHRGRLQAVLLVYGGLSVPCLLSYGAPDHFAHLMQAVDGQMPTHGYAKIPQAHLETFERYATWTSCQQMYSMGITESALVPSVLSEGTCKLLTPDTPLSSIMAVYRDYPGHFFEPIQLTRGLYVGVYQGAELVSIAGTHVYSPQEGIAALGNIATVSHLRGRGLARAACSALVAHLLKRGCRHIALHVAAHNQSALACYRSLGFSYQSTLFDTAYQSRHLVASVASYRASFVSDNRKLRLPDTK